MRTRYNYILYGELNDVTRKITVIDGQPYYESSGTNSQHAGIWFPFVMLKGTTPIMQAPDKFTHKAIRTIFGEQSPLGASYFFKYETCTLISSYHEEEFVQRLQGRIPNKNTLLTSLRLTSLACPSRQILLAYPCLTEKDKNEAEVNRIVLADQAEFLTADPDIVNEWLIKAGAIDVNELLAESLTQPLDDDLNSALSTCDATLFSSRQPTPLTPLQHGLTTGDLRQVFKRI